MQADNNIFEASLPEPYRVLGLRLKPFSLGHYMILKRHGVSFVADGQASATREDLIFSVLVCSQSYDELNAWLDAGALTWVERGVEVLRFLCFSSSLTELVTAFRGTRTQLDMMRWGRQVGLFGMQEKCELFQRYINEHSRMPKYWIEREATHESGMNFAHSVFITLTGNLGFTRERALAMPLSEAFMHFFAYAETQGTVTLMTPEQIEETEKEVCGSTS